MAWALRIPDLDPLSKLILIGLADHAGHDGKGAYPSRELLASYGNCSVRSVQRKLQELEFDCGLIERGDQRYTAHIRADRRPIVYDLRLARGDSAVTPSPNPRGDSAVTPSGARGDRTGSDGVTLLSHKPYLEPNPPTPLAGCPRHAAHVERCRACRAVRDEQAAQAEQQRRQDEREEWARIIRAEIAHCQICDEHGELPTGGRCRHDSREAKDQLNNQFVRDELRQRMGWEKGKGA